MATVKGDGKRKLTIRLDRETIRKAKALAAKRSVSLSALLARQIETLSNECGSYEHAKREAFALLDKGFRLGGEIRVPRDELHER